jgi:hypothetical protein
LSGAANVEDGANRGAAMRTIEDIIAEAQSALAASLREAFDAGRHHQTAEMREKFVAFFEGVIAPFSAGPAAAPAPAAEPSTAVAETAVEAAPEEAPPAEAQAAPAEAMGEPHAGSENPPEAAVGPYSAA